MLLREVFFIVKEDRIKQLAVATFTLFAVSFNHYIWREIEGLYTYRHSLPSLVVLLIIPPLAAIWIVRAVDRQLRKIL